MDVKLFLKNINKSTIFLSKVFLVLLVFISCFSGSYTKAFVLSKQYPANAMWIETSSVTASLSNEFNVTVWINLTQESFAWQIKLNFNTSYLQAIRTGYTNGSKSIFFSECPTIAINPRIDNDEGYILHGETLIGDDKKISGFGSLIWVEFNLTEIPSQNRFNLNFSAPYGMDTFILTPNLEIIPMDTIMGVDISVSMGPPLILYISMIALVIIVTTTTVAIFVIIRKKRMKKHEEQEN